MSTYSLILESAFRQENVDAGHRLNTALENRGGLHWRSLRDARAAARWLASTYSRADGEPTEAVCVVADDSNGGNVMLRVRVR